MKSLVKRLVPPAVYRELVKRRYRLRPSPLDPWRRLAPVAPDSNSRGKSIDRVFIENFLQGKSSHIHGIVLEIADDTYTRRYGSNLSRSDVLIDPRSGATTGIVGDLRLEGTLQPDTYDCIIFTQTLQFIDRPLLALNNLHTALKTGGRLLMTVPGIAQRDAYDDNLWGDFYRWMPRGLRQLMSESKFDIFEVESFGNVLATAAFIYNLAYDELSLDERQQNDADYPLIVACAAVK